MGTTGDPLKMDDFTEAYAGEFLSMGSNSHCQLGDASGRNQWVPQRLNKNAPDFTTAAVDQESFGLGRDVKSLAAGSGHSLAVTNAGLVFSWGFGDYGQLGHPKPATP